MAKKMLSKKPLVFLFFLTVESRPGLIDDVQADRSGHFVDVRMVDFVHEADRRRFERIVLRQVNAHLPDAAFVWSCEIQSRTLCLFFYILKR